MESRTRFAVLGALAEGPRSVYAIKQDLSATVGHFWHESYGQLYPMIRQLADEGCVQLLEEGGPRDRKIYAITPRGEAALRGWLEDPAEYLPPPRNEFLLKMFLGRHVAPEVNLRRLRRHADRIRETLSAYQAIECALLTEDAQEASQPYWLATLRHGMALGRASLAWCEEAEALLAPLCPTQKEAQP